jgi:hypothetical protein
MPRATKKKHAYATIARHPVRSKPRPTAWRGTAEEVVHDCFTSRGVPFGEIKSPRSLDATGAAIMILHERGMSHTEIPRHVWMACHSSTYRALQMFTARLFAEDRAKCNATLDITPATR